MAVPVNIGAAAAPSRPGTSAATAGSPSGFLAPSMLGLLAFTAFPIVASLLLGFYDWPVIGTYTFTGLKNYQTLLTSPQFGTAVLNTVVFVVLYVPLNIVISLGLAVWIRSADQGPRLLPHASSSSRPSPRWWPTPRSSRSSSPRTAWSTR